MHLPYSSRREAMRYLLSAASLLCANDTTQAKEAIHQVPHPRLIANAALWEQLSVQRSQAPQPEAFIQLQLDRARKDLGLAPVERKLEGRRLLGVSREFILRTLLWAFAYRVSGERVFMDRAAQEMLAVAAFLDWHPAHFWTWPK